MPSIAKLLKAKNLKASFFVTGRFLEDRESEGLIKQLIKDGHYVGPHSDQHLLYMPWEDREKLLVTKEEFELDLKSNVERIAALGEQRIDKFIAPYEWYNQRVANWTNDLGLELYNYTPGLRTATDYTYPQMGDRYWATDKILNQVYAYEKENGLNGFIILIHLGTDKRRMDKLYERLREFIDKIHVKNYKFVLLEKL